MKKIATAALLLAAAASSALACGPKGSKGGRSGGKPKSAEHTGRKHKAPDATAINEETGVVKAGDTAISTEAQKGKTGHGKKGNYEGRKGKRGDHKGKSGGHKGKGGHHGGKAHKGGTDVAPQAQAQDEEGS